MQPLAEGIQVCLGPGGLSNSMVVEGQDAVLVVDTQLTPSLGRQVSEVATAGGKPVRYVIITHGDSDHVFGTQEIVPGGVVISHRLTRERILREGDKPKENAIRQRPHLQAEFEAVRIVEPSVALETSLEIRSGQPGGSMHLRWACPHSWECGGMGTRAGSPALRRCRLQRHIPCDAERRSGGMATCTG